MRTKDPFTITYSEFLSNLTGFDASCMEGFEDETMEFGLNFYGTTHTEYLDGVAENEDGKEVPAQLQFTYDDATDIITFTLNIFYAEDGTPLTLTLNFLRI